MKPTPSYCSIITGILAFLCLWMVTLNITAVAGQNRALVIGIDAYQDQTISFPATAKEDARALAGFLEKHLGFQVTLLLGKAADRAAMLKALQSLSENAEPEDTLLIYFSGAAEVESLYGYGWWLGSDAIKGNLQSYLEVRTIQRILRNTGARNVLLISDAPFPDAAIGSPVAESRMLETAENQQGFSHAVLYKSRNETDPPETGGKNGLLVSALMRSLSLTENQLTGIKLFSALLSKTHESGAVFEYRSLKTGRDFSKDFVFTLPVKEKHVSKPVLVKEEPKAQLSIASNADGTMIRINGQEQGSAPLERLVLEAGRYRIEARAAGYENITEEFRLAPGEEKRLELTLAIRKPEKGRLVIRVSPENASIQFKTQKLSYSPDMTLAPGSYSLRVEAPLYQPVLRDIHIKSGEKTEEEFFLTLKPSYENSLAMRFIPIEAGVFEMGSPEDEVRRNPDEKRISVEITEPFMMQVHEVTVGQWRRFVEDTGYKSEAETGAGAHALESGFRWVLDRHYNWRNPGYKVTDELPVSAVSYNDVQNYILWLREKEGLYYDLPTEAEWEYAARAGSSTAYAYGNCLSDDQANFAANSFRAGCAVGAFRQKPLPTGSLQPNNWGLKDMQGNMWEWCRDWYGKYPGNHNALIQNPFGPETGERRVLRGGGWDTDMDSIRVANRYSMPPSAAYANIGFRLVIRP
ncbi:formylglycine-generating enzyme required for sulfatase activity [Desulfobotulus alkaliphilus]|uniref:Formylglycine-generating enzyme required for sulfatase activity n=1 Tax=Desulfobotulus alkaliphilus TaxID=622671 RepID=A0A562S0Y0_9BACT|nr:SUMF1/EgtB/PvdO family nonheme iron enzyme [Desulfobotulus alkaliphilus]TWI74346.1 formylglycine-generating enzyme required for sulfatase activity [Desulfobotulus alkaliphilus]